jgi:hypothetical protein
MNGCSRWRWQFGTEHERAEFGLAPTHPAGVRSEAQGEVSLVSHHAVGSMAISVVPDLFCRIELGGIRRELLQMEPWVGLAYRLDGRPSMNGTAVPAEDDMAAQRPQQRPEEVRHIYGLELCGWKRTGKPRCWRFGDTVSAASAEIRPCLSG